MLVVDDSRFVRASLVRALSSRFRVQQADSGERAWELLLLDGSIGTVLSDLSMPGMDGFELLRRVRGSVLPRVRTVPFAVLSGADDPTQRERALELGADRFVVKGDGADALGDWVASRLAARAALAAAGPTASPASPVGTPPVVGVPAVPAPAVPAPAAPAPAAAAPPRGTAAAEAPVEPPPAVFHPTGSEPRPEPGPRLVPDPLHRWFEAAIGRPGAPGDAPPALLRLYAPGLDALPARLRRGVRSADALHVEDADTAWLCVPASGPLALRLALRFGLLAAGRLAVGAAPQAARVSVCLQGVDTARPAEALAALQALAPEAVAGAGLAVRALAGPWGPAWHCTLPWPAVRLLIA